MSETRGCCWFCWFCLGDVGDADTEKEEEEDERSDCSWSSCSSCSKRSMSSGFVNEDKRAARAGARKVPEATQRPVMSLHQSLMR